MNKAIGSSVSSSRFSSPVRRQATKIGARGIAAGIGLLGAGFGLGWYGRGKYIQNQIKKEQERVKQRVIQDTRIKPVGGEYLAVPTRAGKVQGGRNQTDDELVAKYYSENKNKQSDDEI
jgi:hypothetical protein